MKNSDTCNCEEMLTAIKMYLDEFGYETHVYGACLSVKDPSNAHGIESDSQFVIVGRSATRVSICYDEDIIDIADPDSMPFIAEVVKYCKESKGSHNRCLKCPLEAKRKCRTMLPID